MRRAGKVSILLLLVSVSAVAAKHINATLAAAQPSEEYDEEGYKYGGKFVPNFSSQPWKAHFVQFPYATCQAPYDTFSFVTKIRVCRDTDGFITGLKYWSEHPTRHHDPTTVCDVVGHEGATDCETLKLYTEDWKWRRYRTVTNIRTSKVKDGRDRWRVVYLAFSYSDGTAVEFGSYPQQHGAKHEHWFMKPEPGKICGMNGFYSMSSVCDAKSGYLQWVKPCGKCIPKPHNYKCDADYCTKAIKHKYKGGYKGDFVDDDLYKDNYKKELEKIEQKLEKKLERKYGQVPKEQYKSPQEQYSSTPNQQYNQQQYNQPEEQYNQDEQYDGPEEQYDEQGQYGQDQIDAYEQNQQPQPLQQKLPQQQPFMKQTPLQQQQQLVQKQVPQVRQVPLQQPLQQQQQQQQQMPLSRHDKHELKQQERLEKKQQQQQQQQQQQPKKGLFGWLG